MLIKFEVKSARVKGLSFHPTRPWVLSSLHNGTIQLWDYRMRTLREKFEEHDGPVRGICFHSQQPLFVSGGDDYKIKVWNYKQKKCLFNLIGHLDYVRTTKFHHEHPWIISASDDQTIRVWNWQRRECICTITGHNHYVMSAQFHPSNDLIVSASLDQTIRIWDISGLKQKHVSPGPGGPKLSANAHSTPELFGQTDALVKHVLEGHDRGVNWASFHPTQPLVVSGSDDRQVKIWRYNETKAWEVDTLRGHYNNVSCVAFHPRHEMIISNSEDRFIRVWDTLKRTCLIKHKDEENRFWILESHPSSNLLAAGHDSGFMLFKLERERPAMFLHERWLFYVKDKYMRRLDYDTGRDVAVFQLVQPGRSRPFRIAYNAVENSFLITSRFMMSDSSVYDLYRFGSCLLTGDTLVKHSDVKRSTGLSAVWTARNRFVVLDASHTLFVKNLANEVQRKIQTSMCDEIFQAGTGLLLLRDNDSVYLYDVQQKKILTSVKVAKCRHVVWSPDMAHVALFSKHNLLICTRRLDVVCALQDSSRLKSGVWERAGVFIYTTANHIKYTLINGDSGIIRTLHAAVYLTRIKGSQVYCLDREARPRVITIDTSEYVFKLALLTHDYDKILQMVRNTKLLGQSIISYLQNKGYPEIALHFVKDQKTRFLLALECGNMEVAVEAARQLDDSACWERLASTALAHGRLQIVEMCYQRANNYDALSFLYLITGSVDRLCRLMRVAELRHDVSAHYQMALCVGDVHERVKVLEACGQSHLARLTAHEGGGLTPLRPLACVTDNWPLLNVSKSPFALPSGGEVATAAATSVGALAGDLSGAVGEGWGDGEDYVDVLIEDEQVCGSSQLSERDEEGGVSLVTAADTEAGGWDVDAEGIELPPDAGDEETHVPGLAPHLAYSAPSQGETYASVCGKHSQFAHDQVAVGNFSLACSLLHEQVGVRNFLPYKPLFLRIYSESRVFCHTLPFCSQLPVQLFRPVDASRKQSACTNLPECSVSLTTLVTLLQTCYNLTTTGKFTDAVDKFREILLQLPLLVVETKQELGEVQQMLEICREYVLGLSMEIKRKGLGKDSLEDRKRSCELAAYFTHCKLQPLHQVLTLRTVLNLCYGIKNYKSAAEFARRLLDLGPSPDVVQHARKILKVCEQTMTNNQVLNYDAHNPCDICAHSYTPIYRGTACSKCPLCGATYAVQYKQTVCKICKVAEVGRTCSGMKISSNQFR